MTISNIVRDPQVIYMVRTLLTSGNLITRTGDVWRISLPNAIPGLNLAEEYRDVDVAVERLVSLLARQYDTTVEKTASR